MSTGGGTSECEWRTLGEIFDIRNGYTPSKSNADYWENGTVPWFRMDDIRENGRILSSAMQKVTMQAVKNKPFPANSIIISTSATILVGFYPTFPPLPTKVGGIFLLHWL